MYNLLSIGEESQIKLTTAKQKSNNAVQDKRNQMLPGFGVKPSSATLLWQIIGDSI